MRKFKRILCPVDFSEFSRCALAFAASISRRFRSRLIVQHVVQQRYKVEPGFAMAQPHADDGEALRTDAEQSLAEYLQGLSLGDLQPACVVSQGTATDAILEFAVDESVDLIVMGTHGRQGLDRFITGSVTERVVQQATCSVLVVHGRAAEFAEAGQAPTTRGRKILLCTDLSDRSRRAFDDAWSLATEYGAELTLLHVLEAVPSRSSSESPVLLAVDALRGLTPPQGYRPISPSWAVRIGRPHEEIVALAAEGRFGLVVMAAHGEGVKDPAVFGSTTHRVIQLGPCPVLVVPS